VTKALFVDSLADDTEDDVIIGDESDTESNHTPLPAAATTESFQDKVKNRLKKLKSDNRKGSFQSVVVYIYIFYLFIYLFILTTNTFRKAPTNSQ
jgi:hypothetical protein